MSKKGGKAKANVSEVDKDSPEYLEEFRRKKNAAYAMVQRVMLHSQIDLASTAGEKILADRDAIAARIENQTVQQGEIYSYLRKRLDDNYITIADLEAKVSRAHDEREEQECALEVRVKELESGLEAEKTRLNETLKKLEEELAILRNFQDNSSHHRQKLSELEGAITECKSKFKSEMDELNMQVEEEWRMMQADIKVKLNAKKKKAALENQERLDGKTKMMIALNKKMMSELRFQCAEVESLTHTGTQLLEANTILLAKTGSARHAVQELAKRSHLLQRIILCLYGKLQENMSLQGGKTAWPSLCHKLAGMSAEERQEMLNLHEELRKKEAAISAVRSLVEETNLKAREAEDERVRTLELRAALTRLLAWCHEDASARERVSNSHENKDIGSTAAYPQAPDFVDASTVESTTTSDATASVLPPFSSSNLINSPAVIHAVHDINDMQSNSRGVQEGAGEVTQENREGAEPITCVETGAESELSGRATHGEKGAPEEIRESKEVPQVAHGGKQKRLVKEATRLITNGNEEYLLLWPEDDPVPDDDVILKDVEVAQALMRLFLSKLQVMVEPVTPRPVKPEILSLPALAGITSSCNNDKEEKRVANRGGKCSDAGSIDGEELWGGGRAGGRGRGGRGVRGRERQQEGDTLSLWSDKQLTGIPSWDLLEPAVRRVKRRRTREVACQTASYRELRDWGPTPSDLYSAFQESVPLSAAGSAGWNQRWKTWSTGGSAPTAPSVNHARRRACHCSTNSPAKRVSLSQSGHQKGERSGGCRFQPLVGNSSPPYSLFHSTSPLGKGSPPGGGRGEPLVDQGFSDREGGIKGKKHGKIKGGSEGDSVRLKHQATEGGHMFVGQGTQKEDTPLSRGPDYSKVLLFTVGDDRHLMRSPFPARHPSGNAHAHTFFTQPATSRSICSSARSISPRDVSSHNHSYNDGDRGRT